MKLSERVYQHFKNFGYIDEDTEMDYLQGVCKQIEQLEADSQMLEDLIELLFQPGSCILRRNGHKKHPIAFYYGMGKEPIYSTTSKEAIAAAIKEWKNGKQTN